MSKRNIKINIIISIILTLVLKSIGHSQTNIIIGDASWYGEQFHGRQTASGEIFDMNKLTAAHKTIKFGTYLKVTNLSNKKSIIVKVNDRGPFKGNRILDVSKEAAKELGFLKKGLAKVEIEVLNNYEKNKALKEKDNKKESQNIIENLNNINYITSESEIRNLAISNKTKIKVKSPKKAINNIIYVVNVKKHKKVTEYPIYKLQLGVYSNGILASKQQKALEKMGIDTKICLFSEKARLYRILTKQTFTNYAAAEVAKQNFNSKHNMPTFIIEF